MKDNPYLIPVAILAGGIILAIAIFVTRSVPALQPTGDLSRITPVTTEDHMLGNPEAKVTIVEYSDIDCTHCKSFQATMTQIMADHAAGDIAWVYRHFPIVSAHPYAATHAEAAECVAAQSGTDGFFRFIDALQQQAPGGAQFDPAAYGPVLASLGVNEATFTACMDSDVHVPRVTRDFENALTLGATGTPFSVILISGHDPIPVNGALPYDAMKEIVANALAQTTGTE